MYRGLRGQNLKTVISSGKSKDEGEAPSDGSVSDGVVKESKE